MNVFKDTFWEEFTDISILKKSYKVTEVPPSEQMKLVKKTLIEEVLIYEHCNLVHYLDVDPSKPRIYYEIK